MKIVSSFFHRNMISNEHRFTQSMPRSRSPGRITSLLFNPTVEWYWKCLVKPICLKVGAVMALVMSILVIWSEITFFRCVSQHYSLFNLNPQFCSIEIEGLSRIGHCLGFLPTNLATHQWKPQLSLSLNYYKNIAVATSTGYAARQAGLSCSQSVKRCQLWKEIV